MVRDVFQNPAERPISADDFPHIDEAIFQLTDASDKSPDRVIFIDRGHTSSVSMKRMGLIIYAATFDSVSHKFLDEALARAGAGEKPEPYLLRSIYQVV